MNHFFVTILLLLASIMSSVHTSYREFLEDLQRVATYKNGIFCEYTFQIQQFQKTCIIFNHVNQLCASDFSMRRFEEIDFNPPIPLEKGLIKQARKITSHFHPSLYQDVSFRHA